MKHPPTLFYSHFVSESVWNTVLDEVPSDKHAEASSLLTEQLFYTVTDTLLRVLDPSMHQSFLRRLLEHDPALLTWLTQHNPEIPEILRQTIDRALLTAVAAVH